ncbi:hypothetical protein PC110_g8827 [Phytophthora cactorum]|uniref:Reverse transcriptase Ty1/copia-type domain-containing protein n=1 Tax=Phytophthora cactorum TaxID=29920 RepID=A0A329SH22_9STRA|nr:hypothetical protein PC110_g8827 [Phytophthora cactorum]
MPTPQAKGNFPLPGDPDREPVRVNIGPDVDYPSSLVAHFVLGKRVLRYLQGTCEFGLVWYKPKSPGLKLVAYADADLGNEKDDRCAITGYVLQLNGCTFAYKSKKQAIMTELQLRRTQQTIICEDNQAAIQVINENSYKVKSMELKFHKIRDFVERDTFKVGYCPSEYDITNIFAKLLGPHQFC